MSRRTNTEGSRRRRNAWFWDRPVGVKITAAIAIIAT